MKQCMPSKEDDNFVKKYYLKYLALGAFFAVKLATLITLNLTLELSLLATILTFVAFGIVTGVAAKLSYCALEEMENNNPKNVHFRTYE